LHVEFRREQPMKRVNLIALALAALALLTAIAVPTAAAALNERGRTETVEFDIAEDATRFFFDQNRVTEDGMRPTAVPSSPMATCMRWGRSAAARRRAAPASTPTAHRSSQTR
jgi:hypothetical protein